MEYKFDFFEKEGIENNIFPDNFCCCIIGKPGSGKTTLLRQIMLDPNLLNKKYEYVFICSPSLEEFPFIMNEGAVTSEFSINWIKNRLNEIEEKYHVNVLFIIDDFIAHIYKNQKVFLIKFKYGEVLGPAGPDCSLRGPATPEWDLHPPTCRKMACTGLLYYLIS